MISYSTGTSLGLFKFHEKKSLAHMVMVHSLINNKITCIPVGLNGYTLNRLDRHCFNGDFIQYREGK
jgi:hypothetical protein